MQGLYVIVDTKLLAQRAIDVVELVRATVAVRPAAIQLRAKDMPARELLGVLRAIGPLCRSAKVPLVANDRADLAVLGGCDMVHIGQDDLPYDLVHRIAPDLGIGISTHNLAQLDRAIAQRPKYIAYGPVFTTLSKTNPDPEVGLEGLAAAAERTRAAGIPLVAIGGITLERVAAVAEHADAWAVIADLCPEGATFAEITARAHAFQAPRHGLNAVLPSALPGAAGAATPASHGSAREAR